MPSPVADAGHFTINADTGAVTVAGPINREANDARHDRRVSDGELNDSALTPSTSADVNESPSLGNSELMLAENRRLAPS